MPAKALSHLNGIGVTDRLNIVSESFYDTKCTAKLAFKISTFQLHIYRCVSSVIRCSFCFQ